MLLKLRSAARRVLGVGDDRAAAGRLPAAVVRGDWFSREEPIMGTAIRVELWAEDAVLAQQAIDAVMADMHRIDHLMSPYREDSELSRINREAPLRPVAISEELFELIERSVAFSRLTGGAFDITYASVGRHYDYRAGVRPDDALIARARPGIGFRHLLLDATARTLRFGHPDTAIDLGGFAKGHAVERGAGILRGHGVTHGIVTAGGDSRLIGDRRGRPWSIGIRDPRRPGELAAVLPLRDVAVSTSGDYERYFESAGQRHHHILDPRTGRSPSLVRSVTIIAPDGLTSEGLSKAVFILGPEQGIALIERQKDVDAVIVDASGNLHYSSGLRQGAGPGMQ